MVPEPIEFTNQEIALNGLGRLDQPIFPAAAVISIIETREGFFNAAARPPECSGLFSCDFSVERATGFGGLEAREGL